MNTPIQSLKLSAWSTNCLLAENMTTVEQVAEFIQEHGRKGLLRIPNLRPKCADEVLQAIQTEEAEAKPKPKKLRRTPSAPKMTMRDQFAAMAMQGFASDSTAAWGDGVNGMAKCAYEWADAMLAAREVKND